MSTRYRARLLLVPMAARIARRIGLANAGVGGVLGRESLIAQTSDTPLPTSRPGASPKAEEPLRVVIFSMVSGNVRLSAVEVVLGRALASRGHSVDVVVCDQQLPLCEVKRAGAEELWVRSCGKCYAFGSALFSAAGLKVAPVSSLAVQAMPQEPAWDDHVNAALLKHYRVGRAPQTDEARTRMAMLEVSARKSAAAARAIVARGVDRVIMSHGNYATWGPAREIFLDAKVPVLVHADTTKRDHIRLHWSHDSFWQDVAEEFRARRDDPLSPEEEAALDSYLLSRRSHSEDSFRYNTEDAKPGTSLRMDLGFDGRPTFGLFTNLLWDAASSQRASVFADPVEWSIRTIEWFAARPDLQLIVRTHPAEAVFGTNESVEAALHAVFPELPENVRIIGATSGVNSWTVLDAVDCGLVHTSTVGLELALEGKPCILISDTHYRGWGFTTDISDVAEYFDAIERAGLGALETPSVTVARRYAYILFERYQLPFETLFSPIPNSPVAFVPAAQAPRSALSIDLIVAAIEDLRSPLLPPMIDLNA